MSVPDKPFFVEVDQNGCSKCGHGRTWTVVDSDGTGMSISYEDEGEADNLADMLNDAYHLGEEHGKHTARAEKGKKRGRS